MMGSTAHSCEVDDGGGGGFWVLVLVTVLPGAGTVLVVGWVRTCVTVAVAPGVGRVLGVLG